MTIKYCTIPTSRQKSAPAAPAATRHAAAICAMLAKTGIFAALNSIARRLMARLFRFFSANTMRFASRSSKLSMREDQKSNLAPEAN